MATFSKRGRRAELALAAVLCAGLAACSGDRRQAGCDTPSDLPVPRWVSLKFDEVNARGGPGEDHRILWVYHARGLPMMVIEETAEWRRLRDPYGETAWVQMNQVTGERTALRAESTPLPLLASPKEGAAVRALLSPRSVASLERCKDGWCQIEAGGVKGWAPQDALFGTAELPPCRPRRPQG